MSLGFPQVIFLTLMILGVLIVPANDEVYWKRRYSMIARRLRFALLWWGGFWG